MKILTYIIYTLCLPAFLLSPIPLSAFEPTILSQEKDGNIPRNERGDVDPWVLFHPENLSIDRYFSFIDLICDVDFLETLSQEEFDRVVSFAIAMVRASAPQSREDIVDAYEEDIEELLEYLYGKKKWEIAYSSGFDFKFAPPLSLAKSDISLCKNWFTREMHHFFHWSKRHKKPLIAGAVVIGVVAIAITTGGIGGSSAAAVGGGIIGNIHEDGHQKDANKHVEVFVDDSFEQIDPPHLSHFNDDDYTTILDGGPTLLEQSKILSFEKVEEAKLDISEKGGDSFEMSETQIEKSRNVTKYIVSNIVHDVFESLSEIGTTWHALHPNSTPQDAQTYKEFVASQHEKIDEIFGTYRPEFSIGSQEYAEAYKAAILDDLGHYPEMQVAMLPPPGALISIASRAATVASRALTASSRALTVLKHPEIAGSIALSGGLVSLDSQIVMTAANTTVGWKAGDPVENLTAKGNMPKWATVRARLWKNEALNVEKGKMTDAIKENCYKPTPENMTRMRKGLAPKELNPKNGKMESVEWHHNPPQRDGGLFDVEPMRPADHAKHDSSRHLGK